MIQQLTLSYRSNRRIARPASEEGSVSAELAITMPAVIAILIFALSAMTIQLHRIDLTARAAVLARAVARGETESAIEAMLGSRDQLHRKPIGVFTCVTLTSPVEIAGLTLDLEADSCARTGGL